MKVTLAFIWVIPLMFLAVFVECLQDNEQSDDFELMVKSYYGRVDDVTTSGRSGERRQNRREKRSLMIDTKKMDDNIIQPGGTRLTCQSSQRTPHSFDDVTKVENGTRLHSVLYGVDYVIDSLSTVHSGLTLTCRKEGTTSNKTVSINVLVLPEINLSVFNGESKVKLTKGGNTTLTYTSDVELHCHADNPPPELKLCLSVDKNKLKCEKNSNIISRVDFKCDETLKITCVSSFVDIDLENTLPELAFKDLISRMEVVKSASIQIKVNGEKNASLVVLSTSTSTGPTTIEAQNVSNPLDTIMSHADHKTMSIVSILFMVVTLIILIGLIYVTRRTYASIRQLGAGANTPRVAFKNMGDEQKDLMVE